MKESKLTIQNPTGLHTRPGALFIKEAKKFDSKITITKEDVTVDAKSIVKLLKLGISQNDVITLQAEGADEEKAIEVLTEFIQTLKE